MQPLAVTLANYISNIAGRADQPGRRGPRRRGRAGGPAVALFIAFQKHFTGSEIEQRGEGLTCCRHPAPSRASSAPAGSRRSSPRPSRTCRTSRCTWSTDQDAEAAELLAKAYDARVAGSWQQVLDDPTVDVVVVATPPASHAEIAREALWCGKHVFCEKPLATTTADLEACRRGRRPATGSLVVDHVLRYNPLLAAVARLQAELLGPPQRFLFENDASDEDLHDATTGSGTRTPAAASSSSTACTSSTPPRCSSAARDVRARPTCARRDDRARWTWSARSSTTATTCWPRTRTRSRTRTAAERQLMRLDHGAAETRIEGWIPVRGGDRRSGPTTPAPTSSRGCPPGPTSSTSTASGPPPGPPPRVDVRRAAGTVHARGRGRDLTVPHHARIHLTLGGHPAKGAVYAESVRAAMADLVRAARTGDTPRSGVADGRGRHPARPRRHPRSSPAPHRRPLGRPVMNAAHLSPPPAAARRLARARRAHRPGRGRPGRRGGEHRSG